MAGTFATNIAGDVPLRSANGVMACELGDGLALLHESSGTFYVLGEIESFIWRRTSAPATPDQITGAVRDEYDAPAEEVDRDVAGFLRELVEAKLLEIDAIHRG
jgi:hypothetical protein